MYCRKNDLLRLLLSLRLIYLTIDETGESNDRICSPSIRVRNFHLLLRYSAASCYFIMLILMLQLDGHY